MELDSAASRDWDLIVVGSGPAGASAVHRVHQAAPGANILVVEAGGAISSNAGEHLVEADENAMRESFEKLMRRARQIEYVKGAGVDLDAWTPTNTGIFPASALGHDFGAFPGGSLSWNVGGMGVHWAAASPTPYGEEVPRFAESTFDDDLRVAQRMLRTTSSAFADNPFEKPIVAALRKALPTDIAGRQAQNMPLAGVPRKDGGAFARTGPLDIAPEVFDQSSPNVALVTNALATRVLYRRSRVGGVVARDLRDAKEVEIRGRAVIIAADTLRTPQLLWASGIRPHALGLYLNEHATIDGDVWIDAARLGLAASTTPKRQSGEPFVGAYWSPSIGLERPTHGQMMERFDEDGHRIGMSWYTNTDIRAENRLEFSDTHLDATGMPVMTAYFTYTETDYERIERLRLVQRTAASALGDFLPGDSETLAPGSSLHYTGTVRLGETDDGSSVGDPCGRVWGYENLFVAGNGSVPTALTCNSTLMGIALSVRTADAVARFLLC